MEIRNAVYTADGRIDVELNHPAYGWIPFTADPNDPESFGRAIHELATQGEVSEYVPPPEPEPVVPDRVTARQFKLQLLTAGLLDSVESWIATQSQAVQIAYANSGTFVRDEPMMQAGFAALGFNEGQIDAFFMAAAAI